MDDISEDGWGESSEPCIQAGQWKLPPQHHQNLDSLILEMFSMKGGKLNWIKGTANLHHWSRFRWANLIAKTQEIVKNQINSPSIIIKLIITPNKRNNITQVKKSKNDYKYVQRTYIAQAYLVVVGLMLLEL